MKIKLVINYNQAEYIGKSEEVTPSELEEAKKAIIDYLPNKNSYLTMLDEHNNLHIFPHETLTNSVITFMILEYEKNEIQ